jgi:hypothetical protein
MPDLISYRLHYWAHANEPITERGEVERLARECLAAECLDGLDSTVIETRFNVVRSLVPAIVTTVRALCDFLPPTMVRRDPPAPAVAAHPTSLP